jgi:CheY-like chemotaxis protein
MGFPRRLRVLVIEDEHQMVQAYRDYLAMMAERHPMGEVRVAQGYDDAMAELRSDAFFHLVILDMKIPERAGDGEPESIFGTELIAAIAAREPWPVPVLLIFTGDPARIGRIPAIQRELAEQFWHGQIAAKSADLTDEIDLACKKALAYAEVGVLIRDPDEGTWPGLTARDEDLVRRAVLSQEADAVDLSWWSATRRFGGGWAKVLWGRFVDPRDGAGKPHFFKLEPADDGTYSARSTRRLAHKLAHVQVTARLTSKARALLVTPKAGPSGDRPLSFAEALAEADLDAEDVAREVASQLGRFQVSAKTQVPRRALLTSLPGWDRAASLDRVVRRWGLGPGRGHPAELLKRLDGGDMIWVRRRQSHGDLHTGNVSFDRQGPLLLPYIIDAGALKEDVCGRDLATLEVSVLLHEDIPLEVAAPLYDGSGRSLSEAGLAVSHRNAVRVLSALRAQALAECDLADYAVLLLDAALMQLGGLDFGSAGNRIRRPLDALALAARLAEWVGRIQSR